MRLSFRLCLTALCAWLWAVVPISAADPAVLTAQQQRVEVIDHVAKSVVAIFAKQGQSGGSGVLISSDGYALSNYHVTSEAGDFMKCGLNDGNLYDAVIVGLDPTGDVALLKLLGRDDFPHAEFGDSDRVQVGDWTYALGNPFLLATDFAPTVTAGIVSGVQRYQYPAGTILEYTDCIQVDTSINPGNSGGPLFNASGELIGINGRISIEKRGRVNSGAGYAISINQIKHFLDQLKSGHIVDHATLGATVKTGSDRTVIVDHILETSDAFRRGLRAGDEIVSFANRPIGSVNQFKNVLGIYPKGWTLPLVYRRDGEKHEIDVALRGLHRLEELLPKSNPTKPGPAPEKTPKTPRENPQHEDHDPAEAEKPINQESTKHDDQADSLRKWFVKRRGYANYYFNQLEQARVLQGLADFESWKSLVGRWKLAGKTSTGEDFSLTLADAGVGFVLPQGPYFQPLGEDAAPLDEPPHSGGALLGLHHFRLLLTQGPAAFSDFYYLGSEPIDGRGELVDVMVSRKSGIETHWFFRRADQQLVGFDSYLGPEMDPAKIRFLEHDTISGRKFPTKIVIRCGERVIAALKVEELDVATGEKP